MRTLLLAACMGGSSSDDGSTVKVPPGKDPPTVPTDTEDPPTTETTVTTADTATGTTTTDDACATLPPPPTTWETILVPTSEEFTFDDQGRMLNIDGTGLLMATTRAGVATPIAPFGGSSDLAGVRLLLDGDLAICDEWTGTVHRMSVTTGAKTPIVSGLPGPNSITVDPNGTLYVASLGLLVRVDPANPGTPEVLADLPGTDLDGLTFAPDFSRLYLNHDEGGTIGAIDFDKDMNRLGMVTHASIPGYSELDGMAGDVCGNVYVVTTNGQVWRVRPNGQAEPFIELTMPGVGSPWTTSLNFGSGVGGWERDHLYVMNRSGEMYDLDVGIEGRWEPHLPVP